jgi:hypothetical protein
MSLKTDENDEAVLAETRRILADKSESTATERKFVAPHYLTGYGNTKFFGVLTEGQVRGSLDRLVARGELVKFKQRYGKMNAWTTPEIFAQMEKNRVEAERVAEDTKQRWAAVDVKLIGRGLAPTSNVYHAGHVVPLETIEALLA